MEVRDAHASVLELLDRVVVLVVALDPVERRRRLRVHAGPAREIADTEPPRHVGVAGHRGLQGLEVAVNVGDDAEGHGRVREAACARV